MSLLAVCVAFEFTARQGVVPALLPRDGLTEGMALNWAVFNVAFFTGPLMRADFYNWAGRSSALPRRSAPICG